MTKQRARELLMFIWGNLTSSVEPKIIKEIEAVALPGERLLVTVSRVAELQEQIKNVKSFDIQAIRDIIDATNE